MGSGPGTTLTIPYVTPGEAYTASILLPLLGLVFVSLRLYSGALQKKAINVDDWLMLPALVGTPLPPSLGAISNGNFVIVLGHWDGSDTHNWFVAPPPRRASKLTYGIGIAGKAIAYPTPYEGDLTREQRLTSINPTIRLMGIVGICNTVDWVQVTNKDDAGPIRVHPPYGLGLRLHQA